jgi:uncharacterized membrane protein
VIWFVGVLSDFLREKQHVMADHNVYLLNDTPKISKDAIDSRSCSSSSSRRCWSGGGGGGAGCCCWL